MSQIATTVSELKNDPGRLPSQTIPNPRGNVNADALRAPGPGPILAIGTSWPGPVLAPRNSNVHVPLPFPMQVRAPKKYVMDKEVWELFSKVEINILLLEAIKQIPRYLKFLKELCTNRRRCTRND
ncbi:unnamed protein product [Rhodiola kirilowii]